jgi:hypothetical protein
VLWGRISGHRVLGNSVNHHAEQQDAKACNQAFTLKFGL